MIPGERRREHVLRALARIAGEGVPRKRASRKHCLVHDGLSGGLVSPYRRPELLRRRILIDNRGLDVSLVHLLVLLVGSDSIPHLLAPLPRRQLNAVSQQIA